MALRFCRWTAEPSAIWQCMRGEAPEVNRLIITASGGALRDTPIDRLAAVTPADALRHPTWSMGAKITIDSATLMNKAFEVIEAHWLFGVPWDDIEVVIHPQSVVHSLVEFLDGSVKAQMGLPDMRLPIQCALFYPRRVRNGNLPTLDLPRTGPLTFDEWDPERYPCFNMAIESRAARRHLAGSPVRRRRGCRGHVPVGQHRLYGDPRPDTGGPRGP